MSKASKTKFWLMKSEPDVYSIDDMKRDGTDHWEGIRNYQARNFMRTMVKGDLAFFYHSNAKPPGVVGVIKIVREAYPDPTQFDKKSKYFDAKSKKEDPRWSTVDVAFVKKFDLVSLEQLKAEEKLSSMQVTQKGSRLSVHPVELSHFKKVLSMAGVSFASL